MAGPSAAIAVPAPADRSSCPAADGSWMAPYSRERLGLGRQAEPQYGHLAEVIVGEPDGLITDEHAGLGGSVPRAHDGFFGRRR